MTAHRVSAFVPPVVTTGTGVSYGCVPLTGEWTEQDLRTALNEMRRSAVTQTHAVRRAMLSTVKHIEGALDSARVTLPGEIATGNGGLVRRAFVPPGESR